MWTSIGGSMSLNVGYKNSDRDMRSVEFNLVRGCKCRIRAFPYSIHDDTPETLDTTLIGLVAGVICGTASLVGLSDRLRELGLEKQADIVYSTFLKQQREQQ